MNYDGQIEKDEVTKGCETRVRDEREVHSASGTCECERPLKTPGRNLQDNIKVNLKYYVWLWRELVSFSAGCIRRLLQTG